MNNQKRNASIELLRCVLMLGIVLEHSLSWCVGGGGGLSNILDSCVDGFVFISGYYGIRFKPSKLCALAGLSVVYGVFLNFVTYLISGDGAQFAVSFKTLSLFSGGWFIRAYWCIMFFAPLVDSAFEDTPLKVKRFVLPIFLLVFGWSYLTIIPGFGKYIPKAYGFAPLSYTTLFGVYVFARAFRCLNWGSVMNSKMLIVGTIPSVIIAYAGEWHHNSVVMLFLAMVWFCCFEGLPIAKIPARVIFFVAPSMIAIFLIHASPQGQYITRCIFDYGVVQMGCVRSVSVLGTAIIVFISCLMVDFLRRLMMMPLNPIVRRITGRIDECYDSIVSQIPDSNGGVEK